MKVFFFPLVLEWEDEMITKRGNENCKHRYIFFLITWHSSPLYDAVDHNLKAGFVLPTFFKKMLQSG